MNEAEYWLRLEFRACSKSPRGQPRVFADQIGNATTPAGRVNLARVARTFPPFMLRRDRGALLCNEVVRESIVRRRRTSWATNGIT